MGQCISKNKIIETIKRRRKDWCGNSVEAKYKREECDDLLFVIDNIEIKEVDLEKELDRYTDSAEFEYDVIRDSYFLVAKHFFELGMQVNNQERRKYMTNKEAIKYLQQFYPNGGHCWLDEQRIEAIGMAVKALQEEPVSEEQVKEDTMTIRKEWFEHCKKSWYNEGYIDGEYNRGRQFENPVVDDVSQCKNY